MKYIYLSHFIFMLSRASDPNNQFNGGAGIKAYGHNLRLKNSIVAANRGDYGISYYQFSGSDSYPFISYSLFWENQYGNLLMLFKDIDFNNLKTISIDESILLHPKYHYSKQWVLLPKEKDYSDIIKLIKDELK